MKSNGLNTGHIRTWLLLATMVPTLTGCFGVAVVGAGTGALMIADRRLAETQLTDQGIEIRAITRISEKFSDTVHVNVTSYNRGLLLTGEVPDATVKAEIEKLARAVPNARAITNELQISGNSSLGGRSNDTFITSKVKARIIDSNRIPSNLIKVVTEAGTVYLLGLVTQREADIATEIASTTSGVLKVVRVVEILSEEQARNLSNTQPTTSAITQDDSR